MEIHSAWVGRLENQSWSVEVQLHNACSEWIRAEHLSVILCVCWRCLCQYSLVRWGNHHVRRMQPSKRRWRQFLCRRRWCSWFYFSTIISSIPCPLDMQPPESVGRIRLLKFQSQNPARPILQHQVVLIWPNQQTWCFDKSPFLNPSNVDLECLIFFFSMLFLMSSISQSHRLPNMRYPANTACLLPFPPPSHTGR